MIGNNIMLKSNRLQNHKISFGEISVTFLFIKGMRTVDLILRKCVTFLFTFVLLGMSFAVMYGLSTVQVKNQ